MSTPIDPESLGHAWHSQDPPVETWKPSIKREMALALPGTVNGCTRIYLSSARPWFDYWHRCYGWMRCGVLPGDSNRKKIRIVVDDVPFLAVEVEQTHTDSHQSLIFRTNVNDLLQQMLITNCG
ncbi:MAG: hypothetical protein CM1200mP41_08700 [Gammaproteobacteria bacterium]|nr:MAG: hypothetical protein CM1200mP41_08700 [Gammaproteobacteria bacterium]